MGILRGAMVWAGAAGAWLALSGAVPAQGGAAAEMERLQRDNDALRQRVQRLEADQQRLEDRLAAIEQRLADMPTGAPPAGRPKALSAGSGGVETAAAGQPTAVTPLPGTGPATAPAVGARPMTSAPPADTATVPVETPSPAVPRIQVYGNIELDLTYDSNSNDLGVTAPGNRENLQNAQFSLAAVPSRLGVRFEGPALAGGETDGKVEMDFQGGGDGLLNTPRLRHAYFRMQWPAWDLSVLVGKTYDVVGPLQTDSIGYPAEAFVGDIGYRRSQIQLTQGVRIGAGRRWLFQAAVGENYADLPVEVPALGTAVFVPMLEGRTALDLPGMGGGRVVAGLFGHWGSKRVELPAAGLNRRIRTWSVGGDLSLPLPQNLTFMGEIWHGVVLNTYLYGETVDPGSLAGQASTGGWASLTWRPQPPLRFNLGAGFDNPEDPSPGSTGRQHTVSWFGNVFYDFGKHLEVGAETSYWRARYDPDSREEDKLRFQGTFLYFF
jgi:hypothetical protein